jgi:hypothetical protein
MAKDPIDDDLLLRDTLLLREVLSRVGSLKIRLTTSLYTGRSYRGLPSATIKLEASSAEAVNAAIDRVMRTLSEMVR